MEKQAIHSTLQKAGAAEILPGAEKRPYQEFPTASIKLSPGTQKGFSCSGFPQEKETFVKRVCFQAFSDMVILRDFGNELHREII